MATTQEPTQKLGSRALLMATAAYTVFTLGGLAAFGTLPAASETGDQLLSWVRTNRDGLRWGVWAFTVGFPPFAIMVAMLRRLLPEPHRDVFLVGAIAFYTELAVWTWTWGGLAVHADSLNPATARAILDVACFMGPVLTATTTTMFAPVTLLALRRRCGFPLWLGILGVIALSEQAIETITVFGSTGFTQPQGAMNMQLGASLTVLWTLAFAIWAGLRGRFPETSP